MSTPLKQRQEFTDEQLAEQLLEQASQAQPNKLAAKQVADESEQWQADADDEQPPINLELQPKRSNPWLKYGLIAALVIALGELGLSLVELWQSSPLRAAIYSAVVASLGIGSLVFGLKELRRLRRLKRYHQQQQHGQELMQIQQLDNGQAQRYCEQIAKLQGINDTEEYLKWQQWLNDSHSSQEIVNLYSETVLSPMDLRAKQAIAKWSSEAAILVAISPLALVDMLIMFWRNLKMIEELAKIYGIELGYLSRIRLTKSVFANMIYAAASEVVSDLGSDLLGAELTAKLSSKAAQGIGAGLLTARLGFKAIEQCRPIPWTSNNRPKTKQLKAMLLEKVKQKLSTKTEAN
ncbi:YcjF family protein [Agarivorans gilvus]|uniref:TIGR01620 family protein n=1 Tax=Agarivorans gilvus TaxID=680279 RepID=A0ABQ1HZ45_9ALTE|nr:TIGR01620 family protein [Agarivorans gilvus]GGB00996.1 hypothetical protein GCM10007414_12680 [Agarivorans gilvus]